MSEKPVWKCPECSKQFNHQSSLSRHTKSGCSEVDSVKFECEKCLKVFGRKDSLKRHFALCKPSKETVCQECQKEFPSNWHLERHKISCTPKCPTCKVKMGNDHVCNLKKSPLKVKIVAKKKETKYSFTEWEKLPSNFQDCIDEALKSTLDEPIEPIDFEEFHNYLFQQPDDIDLTTEVKEVSALSL